jgi:hypothetical protein
VLRDAGREAVEAHPGTYASGVLNTVWQQLSRSYFRSPPAPKVAGRAPAEKAGRPPPPTEGEPIPAGQNAWISRPDNSIRDVWTSATHHHFVFSKPSQKPRFDAIVRQRDALFHALPHRQGNAQLRLRLDQLSRWFPRPDLWIAVGIVALFWRRPREARIAIALAFAALVVIVLNALGLFADPHFALPVNPAFVLFGAAAVLAPSGRARAENL